MERKISTTEWARKAYVIINQLLANCVCHSSYSGKCFGCEWLKLIEKAPKEVTKKKICRVRLNPG
jgi:hypothetical protein